MSDYNFSARRIEFYAINQLLSKISGLQKEMSIANTQLTNYNTEYNKLVNQQSENNAIIQELEYDMSRLTDETAIKKIENMIKSYSEIFDTDTCLNKVNAQQNIISSLSNQIAEYENAITNMIQTFSITKAEYESWSPKISYIPNYEDLV